MTPLLHVNLAASRIKWLGQLKAGLDEAQYLLAQLTVHGSNPVEAARVRAEVIALRSEIDLLGCEGFLGQRAIVPDPCPPTWRGNRV